MIKLTYCKFISDLRKINEIHNRRYGNGFSLFIRQDKYNLGTKRISVRWLTGGFYGGDIWHNADMNIIPEVEPTLHDLVHLFKIYIPNLSPKLYDKFCDKYVKYKKEDECGYYGDSYIYTVKSVDLHDAFSFINYTRWLDRVAEKKKRNESK